MAGVQGRGEYSHVKGIEWPNPLPAIWDGFVDSAIQYPDNLALASIPQKGELYGLKNLPLDHNSYQIQPYIRWSYREFVKIVTRLVDALQQAGAKPGFPVFTFVATCVEHPLIFWAAATLGCTIVPIHPRVLINREEAIHVLTKATSTTSVRQSIIFVQSSSLAKQVFDLGILESTLVVAIESVAGDSRYISFDEFLLRGQFGGVSDLRRHCEAAQKWTLIVFTSGTTAFPKGVVHDATAWDRWMVRRRRAVPLVPGDSVLSILPNNHGFYYLNLLTYFCAAGAMVFPAANFSPQDFPEIMEMERCNHFPMSPTMIYAVCQVAQARAIKFNTLKNVTTGGAKLSVELIQNCFEILGSQGVEVMYGCTEIGVVVSTGVITDVKQIVRNGDASVGLVETGAELKICAPEETDPLPANVEGEVHYSGLLMCDGYAGEAPPETFYTDKNGQKWFATGDAGTLNEEGMLFIVGRIKDMIIRGATNIAPAAIEFALSEDLRTKGLGVQVVGKSDHIAGEVPIAVAQKDVTSDEVKNIHEVVLQQMGPIFLPEEVITLGQLGLDDFPRTGIGKIQKYKLTQTVRDYFERRYGTKTNGVFEDDELTNKVQKVWQRTIGHTVKTEANISDFADSITIMRVRDRYAKDLGVKITLADILATKTVKEQIDLLRGSTANAGPQNSTNERLYTVKKLHGLVEDDLIHLAGKPEWFYSTRAYITDEIAKAGFKWEDIQTVTPASDFTHVLTQVDILNTSWSWKFALMAKAGVDKQQLRKGLATMIANNPLLASFLYSNKAAFGSDISLHVIPRPSEKLFNAVIQDYGSVPTQEDFVNLVYEPYEYEMTELPGIFIQFLLFDIGDTGRTGTIMVAHHVTTDASYMQLVFEDLDKALGGATILDKHIDYNVWADSYYSLRTSYDARRSVDWHVNRLNDLSSLKASVFPPLPRPHHFPETQQYIQGVDDNGYHFEFQAKGITNLRQKNPILSAPTIVKTAWSFLNAHRNNTNTAIFSSLQADRRRFPFIPKALEALSPAHTFEASNVAGQTLQDVINIIPIHPEESVINLLRRVTLDQEELNPHAAAPLKTILEEIGPINSEIAIDIFRSQIFNWTPGLGALQTHNPYENYEPLATFIRPSLRLVINVDVGGHDDETVFAQIKSPLYDAAGLESLAMDFADFLLWVCDEANWQRRSGDYRSALRKTAVNGEGDIKTTKKAHII